MKKITAVILGAFILQLFSTNISAQYNKHSRKLESLMQLIAYAYVDSTDEEKLTDDAIRAILKDLDPHSVYIPADELKKMNEPLEGKFEGIGIQFNIFQDTIMVTRPIPGGPSEKLGIRAGDRVVIIDGENVAGNGITNTDVMDKLRGDKGTKVTVEIYRRREPELLEFEITRDKIPLNSVDASYMAEPGVGYIKISKFADSTVEEFKKALAELKTQGMESLILDLSNNGGGYLNRSIELADEFLTEGKQIVYTEGRSSPKQAYNSTAIGGFESGKLVVIINEASASASEIVSGAIQDWDRGLLIGRRSFAKGLVQKPFPLPDGSAVRLTIARYYTPSGRCIQKSYADGDDAYDLDITNRYNHGELYSADSIKFNDSLKFYTDAERIVYGGGGIMPDIFVPLDTTQNSKYMTDLLRKSVLFEYILDYTDKNRSKLKSQYSDIETFKKEFTVEQKLIDGLIAYGEKKELEFDSTDFKTSEALITIRLKALIARDLWGLSSFYQIFNDINPFFVKALESLNDDTFSKMKIANK
jgi:carboxyl-terminal processing protease